MTTRDDTSLMKCIIGDLVDIGFLDQYRDVVALSYYWVESKGFTRET